MMRHLALRSIAVLGVAALGLPAMASAQQTSKSVAVAKELTTLMEQKKLDSIAAKIPGGTDQFAAALYFPGIQLLVAFWYYYLFQHPTNNKV